MTLNKGVMDNWTKRKIGLTDEKSLTREAIETYQFEKLLKTLWMAKKNSKFYGELLKNIDLTTIKCLEDVKKIPFTTVQDLKEKGQDMLCIRQNEISRIVTLDTSGTTGNPKRIYYTQEDQELTIDFFHYGMKNIVDERDVVLILLPCKRPGSVGDLLNTGLIRLGAKTVPYGLLDNLTNECEAVLEIMATKGVTSIVGSPTQVIALAKTKLITTSCENNNLHKIIHQMNSVLLSTEYVPDSTCKFIRDTWDCKVHEHYGMTEMGLGGAVSCWTLEGYHPRESDLYFEIINPETNEVMPDGEYGEVVFTTLTREGMPFIRYRTGDVSRYLTESCKCGSMLKRLDKVENRLE